MSITKETRRESYVVRPTTRAGLILAALETPKTARELMIALGYHEMNAVRPRITELMDLGLVEASGKIYDPVTQRNVAVFRRVINE